MIPTPPQSSEAPKFGVFNADPRHPPITPDGAKALMCKDETGRVIGYAWVIGEHDDAVFRGAAFEYLESRLSSTTGPFLRLVK